jgi:Chalcone-flavanone isomerase.
MKRTLLILLTLLFATPGFAASLAGVAMPDTVSAGGKTLTLNGMGLRKKAIIKVYVAGLYLPAKKTSADAILSADTERSLTMQFLRDVESYKICDAWQDGLKNNSPDKAAALKGDFDKLCGFMEDMEEGGKITFTYVPGTGTTISVNGKEKGTIAGKDFADAMFAAWIGPRPPSEDFKQGLLGGA